MRGLFVFCIAALLALCRVPSAAAVIVYCSEQDFLASAPIVSQETFDEYPTSTNLYNSMVQFDSVFYESTPTPYQHEGDAFWFIGHSWGCISAPNALSSKQITRDRISFGSGQYVYAFGFWLHPSGVGYAVPPRYDIFIDEIGGQRSHLNFSGVTDWTQYQPYYFGFLSSTGIIGITIADLSGDDQGFNWSYDNASRSAIVPEPSSILALLCGLGGLSWRVTRRR